MSDITTLMMAAAGGAAEETDENFNQTVLLLHGDGTNGAQNNTFLDSSTNNFTITRNGNTTQGTFSPFSAPDGRWSNYFDGSGDYLSIADNAAFTLGSSDFTIEFWIYNGTTGTRRFIAGQVDSSGTNSATSFAIEKTSTNKLNSRVCVGVTNYDATSSADLPLNAWTHIAFVRDGNTTRQYINGAQDGTANVTGLTINDSSNQVAIGRAGEFASSLWLGYIAGFRQVVGTCLYTGGTGFTPPTTPLTAISGTSLLTCQSNRFVDNSTNNFAITRNGDVKVTPFSPFAPTAAYSPSVNSGSGYFDGSGDYLNTPSSGQFAPTGDFTVAWWYYPTTLQTTVFIANYTGNNSTDWSFETDSTGDLNVYLDGSTQRITGSTVIKLNQWNYLVVSRSGTTVTAYCNGSSVGTYTLSGTFGSASKAIRIGGGSAGTNNMFGYCAGVSLINGTALDGTIPTAPPTNVSGTELLLNFTNAGIFDNTGKNNLETVADAQIDTTVKKYGTGSMEFDGTGDWLQLNSSTNDLFNFGTGDFTVECWFYRGSTSGRNDLLGRYVSTPAGWGIATSITNAGDIGFYYGNTVIATTSASAWAINTWTHVAVVRSGTSLVIYVNGISSATATNSTNMVAGNPLQVGASGSSTVALNGYIDDLRITKGVARYTTTFTPPDKAFADL